MPTNSTPPPQGKSLVINKAGPPANGDAARAARERGDRETRFARAFAQITAVMMRDANFRQLPLGALEWLVLPPLLAGQWRLGQTAAPPRVAGNEKSTAEGGSMLVPVAAALWARVSPEVDKRLSGALDKPMHLTPGEWTSGDILWLVALAGNPRAMPRFLSVLQDKEFQGRDVKLRARVGADTVAVRTLAEHLKDMAQTPQKAGAPPLDSNPGAKA